MGLRTLFRFYQLYMISSRQAVIIYRIAQKKIEIVRNSGSKVCAIPLHPGAIIRA